MKRILALVVIAVALSACGRVDSEISSLKIVNEENAGRRSLNFYLKANAPVDDLMAELDRHGFDVQHKSGSDQRDGDWSYLEIRWS